MSILKKVEAFDEYYQEVLDFCIEKQYVEHLKKESIELKKLINLISSKVKNNITDFKDNKEYSFENLIYYFDIDLKDFSKALSLLTNDKHPLFSMIFKDINGNVIDKKEMSILISENNSLDDKYMFFYIED